MPIPVQRISSSVPTPPRLRAVECDARRLPAGTGFTLIEIAVVLLIITITIAMVGINLQQSDSHRARDEADRIVILLQAAREEAILQGQVFVVRFTRNGYSFQRSNGKGKLEAIETDDILGPRRLPEGIGLVFEQTGANASSEAGLILDPSGAFDPFTISLRAGDSIWQALGLANGKIQSKQAELGRVG